ncbi:MAG: imidazole glycerol phosphate synthase subunit HisH [Peptococcaceae bacterium]|nr:imidazole glycerol phosphate synthase subunit HisH [Peptococcaceae bacterium]
MIAVIDYGMGNLRSVQKGLEKSGQEVRIVTKPEELEQARGIVLPGVGAFADAMRNLVAKGFDKAIDRAVEAGKPFLGICLGQQLLFEYSEEWGLTRGLGIFPGRVRRLPPDLKVPHMGWNQVFMKRYSPLMDGIPDGSRFYFVHSYYVEPGTPGIVIGETDYGVRFASVVGKGYVYGIQFHPEKSSILGLRILENFGRMVDQC